MLATGLILSPQGIGDKPLQAIPKVITICDVDSTSKECVVELIKKYAGLYDVSERLALAVADCESKFKADALGDGGKAFGPFQFHKETFELFAKKLGEKLDYFSLEDNIKLAIWALANDKGFHWSCYRKVAVR